MILKEYINHILSSLLPNKVSSWIYMWHWLWGDIYIYTNDKNEYCRILLSLTAYFGWKLQKKYVKNVFLHGHLDEDEVHMEILRNPDITCGTNKVSLSRPALGIGRGCDGLGPLPVGGPIFL